MAVRPARADDLGAIVAILRAFHQESSFRDVPFSEPVTARKLTRALSMDTACALVAEQDGAIVGFMLGHCGQYFFSERLTAWEDFVVVIPAARGTAAGRLLIRRFVAWADERGVADVHLGINAGIDSQRSGLFVERLGFEKTGDVFVYKFAGRD